MTQRQLSLSAVIASMATVAALGLPGMAAAVAMATELSCWLPVPAAELAPTLPSEPLIEFLMVAVFWVALLETLLL